MRVASKISQIFGLGKTFFLNSFPCVFCGLRARIKAAFQLALRFGSLEYTKARAIAQIPKLNERVAELEQAIANNWSLSEIRQRISEKKSPNSSPNTESNDYKERFNTATTKLRKSRIWSDPKKRKQIEKLLAQLEMLTNVE